MTYIQVVDLLKSKGYKITENRRVLLEVLFDNVHQLLTIETLYTLIQTRNPKINKSTLYRNIETLQGLNLLFKKVADSGASTYKIICSQDHHHHMICDACGSIVIYNQCDNAAYAAFAKAKGFILTGHTLELHGLCKDCQGKTP